MEASVSSFCPTVINSLAEINVWHETIYTDLLNIFSRVVLAVRWHESRTRRGVGQGVVMAPACKWINQHWACGPTCHSYVHSQSISEAVIPQICWVQSASIHQTLKYLCFAWLNILSNSGLLGLKYKVALACLALNFKYFWLSWFEIESGSACLAWNLRP